MTRNEFINGLKSALENELNSNKVLENINYYNDYINNEIRNGRNESDVISELGDPWAIAKNIISAEGSESTSYEDYSYVSSDRESQYSQNNKPKVHVLGFDSWWKKALLILGIIGVVMIVFSIVTGIISLIAPFIIPIIIISLVLKFFRRQ